jgi:hypothetical protein
MIAVSKRVIHNDMPQSPEGTKFCKDCKFVEYHRSYPQQYPAKCVHPNNFVGFDLVTGLPVGIKTCAELRLDATACGQLAAWFCANSTFEARLQFVASGKKASAIGIGDL